MAFLGYENNEEILELCEQAHKNQIKIVNEIIEENLDEINKISDNNLIIFSCDDMPRSYSGLVAGKIMNLVEGKPTIVGKVINEEFIGSLRSPIPLQEDLDNNDLVTWAKGHENSCGVSINENNVQSLVDYYNTINLSYEPNISVLKSYSIENIPNELFGLFDGNMNVLWGKDIQQPTFHISLEYLPNDIKVMGKTQTTLKLSKYGIDIMFFFVDSNKKEELGLYCKEELNVETNKVTKIWLPKDKNKRVIEIIGTLGINRYTNKYGKTYETNQIIVENYEVKIKKIKTAKDLFK